MSCAFGDLPCLYPALSRCSAQEGSILHASLMGCHVDGMRS